MEISHLNQKRSVAVVLLAVASLWAVSFGSVTACEVMGFSFNERVSGQHLFADFRLRGDLHPDGWGLVHYPDRSAQLFKEGRSARQSDLAKFLTEYQGLKTETMIAFLRTGSRGMGGPAHQRLRRMRNSCG